MTAAEAATDASNERIELLVVSVGGHRCAFELGRVKQVVDYPRVTRVPGTPDAVDGVASVGGEVAAVLDIRRLFGLTGSDEPSFTLLDRKADAQPVGVVACHVDTVEVFPMAAIEPTSEYETDDGLPFVFDDRYVRAVLATNEPIPVMDADALVMAVAGDADEPDADAGDADEPDADAGDADESDADAGDADEPDADEEPTNDAPDADAADDVVAEEVAVVDDEADVEHDEVDAGYDEVDGSATDRTTDTADEDERQ